MKGTSGVTIDRLRERMRAGARRQSGSGEALTKGNGSPGHDSVSAAPSETGALQLSEIKPDQLVLQAPFTPHPDDRYHVNDLLKYSDRNFIQNAYRAILKRGPDATGYAAFIEGLRSGRLNKIDILARLRYSTEGRAKKVRVVGLFFPAAVRLCYQVPIAGYLLNAAVGLARLPSSIRHQQQFEAHVLAQQEQITDHANRTQAALKTLASEIPAALFRLQQSAALIAEQQARQLTEIAQQQHLHREQLQDLQSFNDEKRQQVDSLIHRQQELEALAHEHRQYLESFAAEQRERVTTLAGEHRNYLEQIGQQQEQRIDTLAGQHQRQLATFITEQQTEIAKTHAQLEHFQTLIDNQREAGEVSRMQFRAETTEVENRIEQKNSERERKLEVLTKELRAELARVFAKQQELRAELALQAQRANVLLDRARQELSQPGDPDYVKLMAREADHTLDAFYLALEDQFRGSRTEIKDRLRSYLPFILEAGIGTDDKPILDVGCGRGEWLELLTENGLQASGIDSNRMQVAKSREFGLNVTEADLLSHLGGIPDSSLGAVTGFHIVEHLPIETLMAFLDEALRVVRPGGLVIFETPNPENVLVGSCNFYFDPTHRNPLPGPVLKFLVESRGFLDVRILKLNPSDEAPVKGNTELAKRFNQYFYGPMDYAVIGRRA